MRIRVVYDRFALENPYCLLVTAIDWHLLGKLSLHAHVETVHGPFTENEYARRELVVTILEAICRAIELIRL